MPDKSVLFVCLFYLPSVSMIVTVVSSIIVEVETKESFELAITVKFSIFSTPSLENMIILIQIVGPETTL